MASSQRPDLPIRISAIDENGSRRPFQAQRRFPIGHRPIGTTLLPVGVAAAEVRLRHLRVAIQCLIEVANGEVRRTLKQVCFSTAAIENFQPRTTLLDADEVRNNRTISLASNWNSWMFLGPGVVLIGVMSNVLLSSSS